MKMLAATMPTNPAAIHSIVSMKRSIDVRFISAPHGLGDGGARARRRKPPCRYAGVLLRQGVVFGERCPQLSQCSVRVGPGFFDAIGPGLDQRLGRLLP